MPRAAFKVRAMALTCTSGLTLPSSGPAFGGPLKSNVSPLASHVQIGSVPRKLCCPDVLCSISVGHGSSDSSALSALAPG
jgi:hypothetical protein